ncbi:MAG TPA: hypothetical protein VG965_00010 [Patescibacteria group bacterium]|nr:hypothetical protein [Patescibacteria group bacterium]
MNKKQASREVRRVNSRSKMERAYSSRLVENSQAPNGKSADFSVPATKISEPDTIISTPVTSSEPQLQKHTVEFKVNKKSQMGLFEKAAQTHAVRQAEKKEYKALVARKLESKPFQQKVQELAAKASTDQKVKAVPKIQARIEARVQSMIETLTMPKTQTQTEVKPKTETKIQVETKPKLETIPVTQISPKAETLQSTQAKLLTQARIETQVETQLIEAAKVETQTATKTEAKTKVQPKVEVATSSSTKIEAKQNLETKKKEEVVRKTTKNATEVVVQDKKIQENTEEDNQKQIAHFEVDEQTNKERKIDIKRAYIKVLMILRYHGIKMVMGRDVAAYLSGSSKAKSESESIKQLDPDGSISVQNQYIAQLGEIVSMDVLEQKIDQVQKYAPATNLTKKPTTQILGRREALIVHNSKQEFPAWMDKRLVQVKMNSETWNEN